MQIRTQFALLAAAAAVLTLPVAAQSTTNQTAAPATQAAPATNPQAATGQQPLQSQSNEGFWGKMNPMARKKWVNRQLEPVKGRINELDELSAKNAADIKDVDARAQAGIKQASDTANQANQTATEAGSRAAAAQTEAQQASTTATQLNTTVGGLDQYHAVTDAELRFAPGSVTLGPKARQALDTMAEQLQGRKGYMVQVQGYTRTRGQAGVDASQKMADAVVRYLVEKKNVPLYKISRMGYGSARPTGTEVHRGSVVEVTLLENSLAAMNQTAQSGSPIGATQAAPASSPATPVSQSGSTQ
jgi:outer membrane protein OmpA-like peptidoglycan-associated protein